MLAKSDQARGDRSPMTEVAGKTVYITGAGSGMGLLAGKMLAGLGAHIVTLDRTPN